MSCSSRLPWPAATVEVFAANPQVLSEYQTWARHRDAPRSTSHVQRRWLGCLRLVHRAATSAVSGLRVVRTRPLWSADDEEESRVVPPVP
jgi:hypothetical protein